MKSELAKRWVDVGKIVAKNGQEKVVCPACKAAILKILDVSSGIDNELFERHMLCEKCGAYNSLRLRVSK